MADDDSNLAALKRARESFLRHVEQEQDPIKREKLKEFIPYVEKTFSLHEVDWFRMKAIETADAARVFADSQKSEKEVQKSDRIFWLRTLATLWVLFLAASAILIWAGMSKVYVYQTADGIEMTSQIYEGANIVVGDEKIPMKFNREEMALIDFPVVRVAVIVLAFFGLIAFTLGKTEILR